MSNKIVSMVVAGAQSSNLVRNGNIIGQRTVFGTLTAAQLRDSFKALGHKGNALKAKVNEALRGEADGKLVMAQAALTVASQNGYVADLMDSTAKSVCIRMVKPVEAKVAKAKLSDNAELLKVLQFLGVSAEQFNKAQAAATAPAITV